MDWTEATLILDAKKRNKDIKKVQNNTWLERDGWGAIALRLHATNVLTFHPNGDIEIATGGWDTVTTKQRINAYLPGSWGLWHHKGDLWLGYGHHPVLPFDDGLTVTKDGDIKHSGRLVMTWDEVVAECDRQRRLRDEHSAKHADMLARQHERGLQGAYGMATVYTGWDPDTKQGTYETRQRLHPRTWDGRSWSCKRCNDERNAA